MIKHLAWLAILVSSNAFADPIHFGAAQGAAPPQPDVGAQVPPPAATSSTLPAGIVVNQAPPAGFNPLTATDAQLSAYGYPPRPVNSPDALRRWSSMVSADKERINPILQSTNRRHGPMIKAPGGTPITTQGQQNATANTTPSTSTNWSGFADVFSGQASQTFKSANSYIYGQWMIPLVKQAGCSGGWKYSSAWVGFDGFNSNDVLQAGSDADAYCSGSTTATNYDVWFEWFPNYSTVIQNFTIVPGDVIAAEVVYLGGSVQGGAYIVNYRSGQSVSVAFNPPAGTVFTGNSAEWIVEAPTINGGQSLLPNYVAVPWNYAYSYSSSTGQFYVPEYAPGGTAYSITMTDSSNNAISYCMHAYTYMMWCYPTGSAANSSIVLN